MHGGARLVATGLLAAAACMGGGLAAPARTVADRPNTAVDEARFIDVGGIRQWVTISGQDRRNPIVIFLHGGPGNPLSPYSRSLYGGWTKNFTIVQWDQRGAGRTFGANPGAAKAPLTIEGMSSDGIEVVEQMVQYLGKRQVILVGGSWGSALGVHMIKRRPDLFHAYVGVGQLVDETGNQAATLRRLRGLATAMNDRPTLDAIAALGPPPWSDPRNFGKLRRLTRVYEAKEVDAPPASWWIPDAAYASAADETAYEAGEDYSYLQFVGSAGGGMLSAIDIARLGTQFLVPVYLVQGAEDLVTVPEVSRHWFKSIDAPRKQYVLVPRAGHDPNPALLAATYAILEDIAAQLRRGA